MEWAVSLAHPEINADILESCRQGDRDAFRVVYETHKDRVYSVALYFFHGDATAAADVTQQVFLKLMTDFHHFRGDSAFSTWLYRIVFNTCVNTSRRNKSRAIKDEPRLAQTLASTDSQEADLARKQTADSVRTAISALPPVFRLAILLRYFDDLSYEEMAKILNCSVGTVSSRLSRAHRLLAAKLAPLKAWLGSKDSL